jgi:hypothetical protein
MTRPFDTKKALLWLIKAAILAVVAWGVGRTLIGGTTQLAESAARINYAWLGVAALFYSLAQIPSAAFWHRVLLDLGQRPAWGRTLMAYLVGHLGKYVPGKAMVVVLRAGLVKGPAVDTTVAAASVFFETLTMMAVGAVLAAVILVLWIGGQPTFVLLGLGMAALSGLPTLPPVFRWIVRRIPKISREAAAAPLDGLGVKTVLAGWIANLAAWGLLGLSLCATLAAVGGDVHPFRDVPRCTAACALAVVAGFVAFIPAGAGVRELVLTELLATIIAPPEALLTAVALRIVWLAAELALAGISRLALKGPSRSALDNPPARQVVVGSAPSPAGPLAPRSPSDERSTAAVESGAAS